MKNLVLLPLLLASPAAAYQFPRAQSAAPDVAPAGEPYTRRGEAETWTCFSRDAEEPRVDRHLPRVVCVAGVSVALVIQSDGQPLFEGGARRVGTPHASRALIAGAVDSHRIPGGGEALYGVPQGRNYRVWTVVDRTPEDPGGDSSAVTLEMQLDNQGIPLLGTLKVYGEVACTAPSCQGALATKRVDFAAEAPGSRLKAANNPTGKPLKG